MIVGYARTSTAEQEAGLEAQLRDLEHAGVEKIFQEHISSVVKRDKLDAALDFVREGDVFVVTKLDRLARSIVGFWKIVETLEAKKVTLRILAMNLDTSTPTGRLMLTVMGGVAQFEREMMLERQKEGIAKAKAGGKYKGRAPTARRQLDRIKAMKADGVPAGQIADRLGIARSSVYRLLD